MISKSQVESILDQFDWWGMNPDWLECHTDLKFDDISRSITIKIWNINENDYRIIKGGNNA